MAEDGMLLNFSTDPGISSQLSFKPSYKGGHWKERLHVKRQARRHHENRTQKSKPVEPPVKRLKLSEANASEARASNPEVKATGYKNDRPRVPESKKEVISSLFTYNPKSSGVHDSEPAAEGNIAPTNAPLIDGIDTFTSLGLSTTLSAHLLLKMGIKSPTAIQKSAIKQLLDENSDAFVQAETGSGKTLAYLLPILQRVIEISKLGSNEENAKGYGQVHRDSGLFAIILAPTRELSKQISVVLESLLRCAHWIVAGTVIGGEKKKSEKARLRKGLNILVATPGRLVDHLTNTEVLDVSNVRWLVLDEGDRLMELGFENDIRTILSKLDDKSSRSITPVKGLPDQRVNILCSATMKTNVEKLGEMSLHDAIHIKASEDETEMRLPDSIAAEAFLAPAQLKQAYSIVAPKQRLVTLAALLRRTFARKGSVNKCMVFVSCSDSVDFHFSIFSRNNRAFSQESNGLDTPPDQETNANPTRHPALAISTPSNPNLTVYRLHGSLPQSVRTSTLKSFATNSDPSILICTDVASRGLDLPSIDLVVEYDPAFSAEDHLHRIGRTARAGRDGRATIFLMPGPEEQYVEILRQSYKEQSGAMVSNSDTNDILRRGFDSSVVSELVPSVKSALKSGAAWDEQATAWQLDIERFVIDDGRAGELARKAYVSHVRAYATHIVSERHIFNVANLHLGHLAKAFALRDKPGSMGRGSTKGKRRAGTRGPSYAKANDEADNEEQPQRDVDTNEAAKKMRKAMKAHMGAANEFNIG